MNTLANSDSGFAAGFISALLLAAAIAFVAQLVTFVIEQPQPEAIIEFLTTPRLSITDVFGTLIWLLVVALIILAVQYGPRIR